MTLRVVHRAADARDDAADDRGIRLRRDADRASGQCREPLLNGADASLVDRHGCGHDGANDMLVIEQTVAVRGQQVREQDQSIAFGQQQNQLRQNRRELRVCQQIGDGGVFTLHRHGGIQQHLCQRRILRQQIDELRELVLDLIEVRLLLDRDVEERARVAEGSGLVCHDCSAVTFANARHPPGRFRRVELAKSFTSNPNLYHSKTFPTRLSCEYDLTTTSSLARAVRRPQRGSAEHRPS